MKATRITRMLAPGLLFLVAAGAANAVTVVVTIENLAPVHGNFLTPVWVGFHDGSFDTYDAGAPAAGFLESLAEDGNTAPISAAFTGGAQGTLAGPGGPLAPGEITTMTFDLDPSDPNQRYFSFASMIIPSNDAFIANGNPLAHMLFDASGSAFAIDFFVLGAAVLDAGTEVNDEVPANTAFFGQMSPNTGVDEGGVVELHGGFMPAGSGGIVDDPMFTNADFTRAGYPIAQVRVSVVPVPAALWLMASALLGFAGFVRRH